MGFVEKIAKGLERAHKEADVRRVEFNQGPWVRLYMNGRDGQEWPWCADFASYVLKRPPRRWVYRFR